MTGKGIRLSILRATGDGMEDALVEFKPGLNIIAYLSQTGKTYILQCINFLMGGKTKPKNIKHSRGYDTLWLQFEDVTGAVYVLMRKLDDTDYRLYNVPLDQIESSTTFKKQAKTAKSKNSASMLIAELSGFPKAELKSNRYNAKSSLTFRTMSHFFIVHELLMIGDDSPVFSGHVFSPTTEKSAFKYLITGKDDSNLEEIEGPTPEQIAASIRRQLLAKLIDQLTAERDARQKQNSAIDLAGRCKTPRHI